MTADPISLRARLRDLLLEDGVRWPADDFYHVKIVEEIDSVARRLADALEHGRLALKDAHSSSELVLESSFHGRPEDIFRGIHFIDDTAFMNTVVVRHWRERVDALLAQGRLLAVRRLIPYRTVDELEQKSIRGFLDEHARMLGYEAATILQAELFDLLADHDVHAAHDFGIYGQSFVFESASGDPGSLAGTWYRSAVDVERYTIAFDACWSAARSWERTAP